MRKGKWWKKVLCSFHLHSWLHVFGYIHKYHECKRCGKRKVTAGAQYPYASSPLIDVDWLERKSDVIR